MWYGLFRKLRISCSEANSRKSHSAVSHPAFSCHSPVVCAIITFVFSCQLILYGIRWYQPWNWHRIRHLLRHQGKSFTTTAITRFSTCSAPHHSSSFIRLVTKCTTVCGCVSVCAWGVYYVCSTPTTTREPASPPMTSAWCLLAAQSAAATLPQEPCPL
jgi:hypothetical protein